MNSIKIIKGLPLSVVFNVTNNGSQVDLHDGTWTTAVKLKFQTERGTEPFQVTTTNAGNGYLVEISSNQSALLSTKGVGYVLVIKADKNDGTANIRNVVPVKVINDL